MYVQELVAVVCSAHLLGRNAAAHSRHASWRLSAFAQLLESRAGGLLRSAREGQTREEQEKEKEKETGTGTGKERK